MNEPGPDALRRSVLTVSETLSPHVDNDWSAIAGDLEWSCRRTLDHTIDALLWYAANLSMLSTTRRGHLRDGDPNGSIDRILQALVSAGNVLARIAEATPPGGRGYHGTGMADATGFMAMGCDEVLVHASDICAGLDIGFRPPDDICEQVVARLFPWAPEHGDPWALLLWCNGRVALPGHERLSSEWGWWSATLAEWDGTPYTDHSPGE